MSKKQNRFRKRAVFIDRSLIFKDPDIYRSIRRLKAVGFLVIGTWNVLEDGMVKHQTAGAKEAEANAVKKGEQWRKKLATEIKLDGAYYCPHNDDKPVSNEQRCDCHKSMPGQFKQASTEHRINLARSFVIAATGRDMIAAICINATCIAITKDNPMIGEIKHDYEVDSFEEAVTLIGSLASAKAA